MKLNCIETYFVISRVKVTMRHQIMYSKGSSSSETAAATCTTPTTEVTNIIHNIEYELSLSGSVSFLFGSRQGRIQGGGAVMGVSSLSDFDFRILRERVLVTHHINRKRDKEEDGCFELKMGVLNCHPQNL